MASKRRKLRKIMAKVKREERLAKLGATFQLSESSKAAAGATTASPYVYRGMGGSYPATGTGVIKRCTHGARKVFTIGAAEVWAGASMDIKWSMKPWKLLLCCAGADMAPEPEIAVSDGAQQYFGKTLKTAGIPYVALNWPDGGTPCFNRAHWQAIVDGIAKVEGLVGVYCMGGHGRTGTALAILGCLSEAIPRDEDPVRWVREHYCDEAVEADKQVNYIERIAERTSRAMGSDPTLSDDWDTDDTVDYLYGATGRKLTAKITPRDPDIERFKAAINKPHEDADKAKGETVAYIPPPSPPPLCSTAGGVVGTPILNGAGDVIGYDYRGTRLTETTATKPVEAAKDGAGITGPQPWQKWSQRKQEK